MTDSLPTHPASTDTPAEGGAVALNGEETERLCYFVAALEMFGKHGGNLISREAAAEVSDLLDRALKRIAALSRPAPIEPGAREKALLDRLEAAEGRERLLVSLIRECRLADGHAARTGDEARWNHAFHNLVEAEKPNPLPQAPEAEAMIDHVLESGS